MEKLLANLIKHKLGIIAVFVFLIGIGVKSFNELPIDAFPDLTNNQVSIMTTGEGMAPAEIEQLITVPIESVMNGLPNVEEVRSVSKFGLSVVTVVFKESVNTYFARQLVSERLQGARSRLPANAESELGPPTTGMGEIYQYVLESKTHTSTELKTINDWDIKYQLRTVPGVSEVNTWGGFTQEYSVILDPQKLTQYNLTISEVFTAIEGNNENFSGGIIEHDAEQYIVRGLGRANTIEDISNIVVTSKKGTPITIGHIAHVGYGKQLRQGAVTKDGNGEIVTGIVMMLKGENSRAVIQRVKEKIEEIKKTLPEGVTLNPYYDQTNLVEQTVKTVQSNLIEAGVLVIVILLLMLGNIKAALIVSITIPISMMFSFMGMKWLGISANIMSLGAIDFGMIVDGSVVIVENTIKRLGHEHKEGKTFEIIQESLKEMAKPILFGTLIIAVVYLPILSLEGVEYKMFSPMVFTVCFALLGSLLTALTLVPVMCSLALKGKISEEDNFIIKILKPIYNKSLNIALKNRVVTLSGAIIFFIASVSLIPFLGTEFVPKLDEGDILVELRNIPSISLSEAVQVSTRVEKSIRDIPEIKTVVSKSGRPDLATDNMGTYQTDQYIILKPRTEWRKGLKKEDIIGEIRARLEKNIAGTNFNFTQPISMRIDELVSGVRSDIAIKIFGEDNDKLKQVADQVSAQVSKVRGNADLQVENLSGNRQIIIQPNRFKMAQLGVNISDLRQITETAIMGKAVSEIVEGKKRFTLRVGFEGGNKYGVEDIKELLLKTQDGNPVKLGQVAEIFLKEDLDAVNREFGERRIIVQCNVRDRDMGSFVKEAQGLIDKNVKIPVGYYIKWGGQFENQERAMSRLSLVVPVSVVIIFMLLMATFSSVKHSTIVILNIPFALTGGIIALYTRQMYLSVPAIVGFIALFGVAVLNGIVLISTINKVVDEEEDNLEQAIKKASEERLRPVLMTALVATFGFLPMAISTGSGAEVQKPLATVVIGGLVTSTLLTLIVLPVIYRMTHSEHKIKMRKMKYASYENK